MTLYEITEQLQRLYELSNDPEVDPEVLADTMDAVEGDFEEKADGYAKVLSILSADADALGKEIERLQSRKRAVEGNATRIKDHLQEAMAAAGKPKFKTTLYSFGIQKNPAAVVLDTDDVFDVPAEYLIPQAPKVDKTALKNALKAGVVLDGIAHLAQTESLRIR